MQFRLRSHLTTPALLACAVLVGGCAGSSKGDKATSPRAQWVDSPTSGSQAGDVISIPGLAVKFHVPDTLYVFQSCSEASHSPAGPDGKWIPVVECSPGGGGSASEESEEDSWSEDESGGEASFSSPIRIYVAKKDMVINERAVETFRTKYKHEGWTVDDIGYISNYQNKDGRTGIEMRVHQSEGEEILRFIFPVDDVMFIVQVEYPQGADRSGMAQDWQRIVWCFQLDEHGPLYPNA